MKVVRIIAIVALVYLALSGIVGAFPLLVHPAREPWGMPQRLLQYSPFHSYFIPGIILLVANGLLCLWVLWLAVRRHVGYGWWVAMLRLAVWPHYLFAAVALVLVITGLALARAD